MEKSKIWMVRAGSGGLLIERFLKAEHIAIGWDEIGEIPKDISYEELKIIIKDSYPDDSDGRINQVAGQIWRFYKEFSIGDKVVTYDSYSRVYYQGEIVSGYKFNNTLGEFFHIRDMNWSEGGIDRDLLSTSTKNTLGSVLTIFEINIEIWEELTRNHPGYLPEEELELIHQAQEEFEQIELESLKQDVISKSKEFIKDIIFELSWEETEQIFSGVLKAMGYKTRLTDRGADRGVDIVASPDGLGMEEPRIKVEVKKRNKDKISGPELRNFIGGLRGADRGIYFATTGFTKDAKYEAERANFPITLIDSSWLVELITENYEQLDPETKALVPLKKIYWPA